MKQKRAHPLSVWQTFGINLLIVAVVFIVALTQHIEPTATPPANAHVATVTALGDADPQPTPTAAAPATRSPVNSTARPTPATTSTHTPTAVTPTLSTTWPITQTLGVSTLGWPIQAYQFGAGPVRLAFVGGIHGGYEWNTILLAYEAIDYFTAHPEQIPASVSLYVVPSANPDGQARVLGHGGRFTAAEVLTETAPGRFNGNGVDLNRNWDQDWTPVGTWGVQPVSGGDAPFSEVETQILRDFFRGMEVVVLWHSARPGVYMAACDDVYPPSRALAAIYARASGYPLYEGFYDYAVTGNATDWLACAGITAIAVELTDHTATDGAQNLAAVQAVIDAYALTMGP